MHAEAWTFIANNAPPASDEKGAIVLECGARNINGTVRDLWPRVTWVGVDITDGAGVDVVADFATYRHPRKAAVVVCCEVFEHTENWRAIVESAAVNLRKGGTFLTTMAGPGRSPHSATDGGELRGGEWYRNIEPDDLADVLTEHFTSHEVDILGPDVRAVATK